MKRTPPRDPAVGDLVGGKFRLLRRIGVGGMGTVWEADAGDEGRVALKILHAFADPKLVARLEREALTVEKLESPHIVDTLGQGTHEDGTPFLVLELLEGEDLGARLKRVRRMTYEELAPIAEQIGDGLARAHELGIVHRDLKPANIFLCRARASHASVPNEVIPGASLPPPSSSTWKNETVKLLDFGVARCNDDNFSGLTTAGRTLGSPHYMSPEQASGRPVDARSDLWSFGVLLYRALTGRRPFDADEIAMVMVAIAKHSPPKASSIIPDLPAGIDGFFTRALRKDAEDRFQTVADMVEAFVSLAPSAATATAELTEGASLAAPTQLSAGAPHPKPESLAEPPKAAAIARPRSEDSPWSGRIHWILIAALIALSIGGLAYARRDDLRAVWKGWFGSDTKESEFRNTDPHPPPATTVVPKVALKRPDGGELALPLPRRFVLNIWLQRCPDCMPAFDSWKEIARRGELPDLPVVNVAYLEVDTAWAESYAVTDNLIVDSSGRTIVKPLGVSAFTTFVVEPDGTILFRASPKDPKFVEKLAAAAHK